MFCYRSLASVSILFFDPYPIRHSKFIFAFHSQITPHALQPNGFAIMTLCLGIILACFLQYVLHVYFIPQLLAWLHHNRTFNNHMIGIFIEGKYQINLYTDIRLVFDVTSINKGNSIDPKKYLAELNEWEDKYTSELKLAQFKVTGTFFLSFFDPDECFLCIIEIKLYAAFVLLDYRACPFGLLVGAFEAQSFGPVQ